MNLLTKKNNFLFFAMLVFIFVASTALSISGQIPKVEALVKSKISESKNFPPLPVLGINSSFPILSAQGVIANDAAETLAQDYPGGYDAFINAMNTKAQDLSMTNSHFDNPVGLDGDGQRSTAKDLVRVSEVAMRNSEFAKVVGTKNITVHDDSTKFSYNLRNVNELLGSVPGVMGVKTGWTENARENLVTYIERDNHKIMIAILGSQDRFGETKELIDWIFTNYKWQEVKFP